MWRGWGYCYSRNHRNVCRAACVNVDSRGHAYAQPPPLESFAFRRLPFRRIKEIPRGCLILGSLSHLCAIVREHPRAYPRFAKLLGSICAKIYPSRRGILAQRRREVQLPWCIASTRKIACFVKMRNINRAISQKKKKKILINRQLMHFSREESLISSVFLERDFTPDREVWGWNLLFSFLANRFPASSAQTREKFHAQRRAEWFFKRSDTRNRNEQW